ncbi:MAG: hypothetical protein PHC47_03090, partial [Clostridia bacterium]|nr:hypothetical protein [Clostridia bacterium]
MKKFFIGFIAVMMCFVFTGCDSNSNGAISSNLHSRMDKLSSELKKVNNVENEDITFNGFNGDNNLVKVALNGGYRFDVANFNRNTDTYGNFYNRGFNNGFGGNGVYGGVNGINNGFGGNNFGGNFGGYGNNNYGGNYGGNYG